MGRFSLYVGPRDVEGDFEADLSLDRYLKEKSYGLLNTISFLEEENLFRDFLKYSQENFGGKDTLAKYFVYDPVSKIAKGSSPKLAVAFNMFCEDEGIGYEVVSPSIIENFKNDLPNYFPDFYVNTALVLRSWGEDDLINSLCRQASNYFPNLFEEKSGYFFNPLVIPLKSLELNVYGGFDLVPEKLEEAFLSPIFSRDSGNFSDEEINEKGVPEKFFNYGDRHLDNNYSGGLTSLDWNSNGLLSSVRESVFYSNPRGRILVSKVF